MTPEKTIKIILVLFVLVSLGPGVSSARQKWEKSKTGVGSLMTLSKDMGKMNAQLKKDTSNYNGVRHDLDDGKIEMGQASENIRRKYGEPVYTLEDPNQKTETWVYKAGTDPVETKNKVYLVFSEDETLIDCYTPEKDPGTDN